MTGLRGLAAVVAIDGTASSGKGTVAGILGGVLGFHVLHSGMIYRAAGRVALLRGAFEEGVDSARREGIVEEAAMELVAGGTLGFSSSGFPPPTPPIKDGGGVNVAIGDGGGNQESPPLSLMGGVGGGDSLELESEEVGRAASALAAFAGARAALLPLQRSMRRPPGLVAEGRDMGTVVFPDAVVKIFLDADLDARAERRAEELRKRGASVKISDVRARLAARDAKDKGRLCAPLRPADGAFPMDGTLLSAKEIAEAVAALFFDAARAGGGAEQNKPDAKDETKI